MNSNVERNPDEVENKTFLEERSSSGDGKQGTLEFRQDLTSLHLIWVKAINFLHSAALATIYPFFTIHMRSLGFSAEQTALVNFISPLVETLVQIPSGLLADKIGNFRVLVFTITLLCGISPLALIFTPPVIFETINGSTMCCDGAQNSTDALLCWNSDDNSSSSFLIDANATNLNCTDSIVCKNSEHEECFFLEQEPINFSSAFAVYLVLRIMVDVFRSSMLILFGGAFIAVIIEHRGDFGRQKIFSPLGGIIFGPIAGVIVQYTSNYNGVFGLFGGLVILSAFLTLRLNLEHKPAARNLFKQAF